MSRVRKGKMSKNYRNSTFSNLIWRFAERCGAQGVAFVVSIVLARLLTPDIYGTIALVTVFTKILQVFVDSGLGNALIQKKDADDLDFSTVFYFNIAMCVVLYIGVCAAAPFIASFYNKPELTMIIRVLSLTLVISGVKNVQQAYVSRHLMFKRFFYATLGGTMGAACIGILMAYMGFGVWALVAQQLFNATVDTLILWKTVKWRPKRMFSYTRLKGLLSYGWKLLASALLNNVYGNLRQLIIGKIYSTSDLAFYNKAEQLTDMVVTNINISIDSVLLPVMSREQENRERVKNMTRRAIKISTYVLAPMMMGLAVTSANVVELLLTEKWLPCVPFIRIFCISNMFYAIHTANLNAIKAMGRSDWFLKLEVTKKVLGLIILLVTMRFGVMAMVWGGLVQDFIGQIINSWPNRKLLNYGYGEQLKDILPGILMAVVMGICVWFVNFISFPMILTLVLQVILGVVIYILCSIITKNTSFEYLCEIAKSMIKKFRNKEGKSI